ncbi:MAG: zinc ribbon domain-containing protein [Methanobrevibacter thaueri]|nr:zinc ribbon domain-containing protein [Methanobrevibacter thaueri]
MTRICENCEFENKDEYDYCAKCGTPLVDGLPYTQIYIYDSSQPPINKKALILSYIVTIFLSWIGFIVGVISKQTNLAVFTFFGFFMPFYLVQSKHPVLRKHGLIMMLISLIGVGLSFYVMFH